MKHKQEKDCLLLSILRKQRRIAELTAAEIDLLIRQARPSRLLSTIAVITEQQDAWDALPEGACGQLKSALILSEANLRTLKWELNRIQDALCPAEFPVILLKGAAYAMLDLPNAQGRLFGDIDLLVPRECLETVETRLNWKGWFSPYNNPYDQKYFREWMHELPPLQHTKRQSVLDVHHTIVAPTSRIQADTTAIFSQARRLDSNNFFHTLCPEDLILHSATHLFVNGEFEHGVRDLYDMHTLLCHYGRETGFYDRLCQRANQTDLSQQLYHALRYCQLFLRTPVPDCLQDTLLYKPVGISHRLLDKLFSHALLADHQSCRSPFTMLTRHLLFIRSHYLRMPFRLLIPHLIRKAFRSDE